MPIIWFVLFDSVEIQEEVPGLRKPVSVMRNTVERTEHVDTGIVLVEGSDKSRIIYEVSRLLNDQNHNKNMTQKANPFSDGKTCNCIVVAL